MFAQRLKTLRKERGLTQTQFAQKFNVSSGAVGMWETGKREPDIETINRLAKFFQVSVDYLLGSVSEPWFYLDMDRTLREINSYGDEKMPDREVIVSENKNSPSTDESALREELAKEVSRLTLNLSDEQRDLFLALLRLTDARNRGLPVADLVLAGEAALKSQRYNP